MIVGLVAILRLLSSSKFAKASDIGCLMRLGKACMEPGTVPHCLHHRYVIIGHCK